jgi:hypothetical protein
LDGGAFEVVLFNARVIIKDDQNPAVPVKNGLKRQLVLVADSAGCRVCRMKIAFYRARDPMEFIGHILKWIPGKIKTESGKRHNDTGQQNYCRGGRGDPGLLGQLFGLE